MSLLHPPDGANKNPSRENIQEQLQSGPHDVPHPPGQEQDLEAADDIDIAEIERIYRKIDFRIIPAFWVLYFLCSAIRSNVGLAQTMNMESGHDLGSVLNATPRQISTGLALFYVCYVVFDLPSNLIMTKLSPHVWMSRIVIGVGVIGSCMAAMKAAWSLYLLRLLLGIVIAGMWPGMAYYLTLFYPPSRTGKRIGQYYTAAQLSAAVVGLVSAGFQKMDGERGLVGFQWMFLVYGVITVAVGFGLLFWLPDRPVPPGQEESNKPRKKWLRWIPRSPPVLTGKDAEIHYRDLTRVYKRPRWTLRNLLQVLLDWRLWPLLLMYFGVVGVGIGVQNYATVIIKGINPSLSGINLSLLTAPIWICDLIAILLVTPLSDRFHHHRAIFFSFAVCIQILGLLLTTYAGTESNSWPRYGGLLIVGFGLGPTVPITMTWTTEIFQPRHGEVGVAAASAVVSGWGNLGSILTTYALYNGWDADANAEGRDKYRKSNLVMVGILCGSILSALCMHVAVRLFEGKKVGGDAGEGSEDGIVDGAARREVKQRGLEGLGAGVLGIFKKSKSRS
ncbi:major facilitator superfamily domain-containing protein [Aspergillus karnatakaensis]|uniref:putative MFS transporter n=1 Tax=Aspergillus karnatakaensis TaxID=1810916 RepID=UPI003CCD765C